MKQVNNSVNYIWSDAYDACNKKPDTTKARIEISDNIYDLIASMYHPIRQNIQSIIKK